MNEDETPLRRGFSLTDNLMIWSLNFSSKGRSGSAANWRICDEQCQLLLKLWLKAALPWHYFFRHDEIFRLTARTWIGKP